jgi:hypothetical protein
MTRIGLRGSLALLLAVTLAGCAETPAPAVPAPAPAAPPAAAAPPPAAEAVPYQPSAESRALALYYRRLQDSFLSQGLLRSDGGGPDTPFTDAMLARNFVRIALFDEYAEGSGLSGPQQMSRLRRWDQPIRMSVEHGASTPADQAARDRASVAAYAARLSRLTGVRITQTRVNPNFHVLFLDEDERRAIGPRLREMAPGIADSSVIAIQNLPRSTFCLVVAFSQPGRWTYARAIAIVRAEHPDLMRLSCIHEELAQGMGLANDSPQARPSIFNDDEEFALLTRHDELLLRMLYDPRLSPGMTPAEAAPIARQIAAELMGGGS